MSPDNDSDRKLAGKVVIEVYGEGRTDVGARRAESKPESPTEGVVPILLSKLCDKPDRMRVKRKPLAFLRERAGWKRKIEFAKRQAYYNQSDAVVFVRDSEGEHKKVTQELEQGRHACCPDFPMVVGVAHPCIESWLLADGTAIRRAMSLSDTPAVPDKPEALPAPCQNRTRNPKTELARCAGSNNPELSAREKDDIAQAMNDMSLVRERCPLGFAPFAEEVETLIRPLF